MGMKCFNAPISQLINSLGGLCNFHFVIFPLFHNLSISIFFLEASTD